MTELTRADLPGLFGSFEQDKYGWIHSTPMVVPWLDAMPRTFLLDGFTGDPRPEDFFQAIWNFLGNSQKTLTDASAPLLLYSRDGQEHDPDLEPLSLETVWDHVRIGTEIMVERRSRGDQAIYLSIESGCEWEEEHGLQLIFREGRTITKLGQYDSHLTNSDAFGNSAYEDVVYVSLDML